MIAAFALGLAALAPQATDLAAEGFRARVELPGDRVVSGEVFLDAEGRLAMRSRAIEGVALLDVEAIRALHRTDTLGRAVAAELDAGAGDDVLSLLKGETLVGRARSLGPDALTFESRGFGELRIPRDRLGVLARGAEDGRGWSAIEGATDGSWDGWEFSHAGAGAGVSRSLSKAGAEAVLRRDLGDTHVAIAVAWDEAPSLRVVVGEPADEQLPAGVALELWDGHPTLLSHAGGELSVAHAEDVHLPHGSGGVLYLEISREDGVRALGLEGYDGQWFEFGLSMPLAVAPDVLRVQAPGGPLEFFGGPVVEPLAGPGGRLEVTRVVRGAEVVGLTGGEVELRHGRASLDDIACIAFVPPAQRGALASNDETRRQGWVELVGGECIAATGVDLEGGRLVVRSPRLARPARVDLASVHSIMFPTPANGTRPGGFRFHFGPGAGVVAQFGGIEREGEDGPVRVLRSEPGFLGATATTVDGTFKMTRDGLTEARVPRATFPTDVVLESGEAFPAAIRSVDDAALTVTTPLRGGEVRIPRAHVRAIVFAPRRTNTLLAPLGRTAGRDRRPGARIVIVRGGERPGSNDPAAVTEDELERALLVPRAQAADPGTVLLVAKNGDLMRTNVVAFDAERGVLRVDGAGGGPAEIPVDRLAVLARIEGEPDAPEDGPPGTEPEPIPELGGEWTLDAGELGLLLGEVVRASRDEVVLDHPVLGEVRVDGRSFDSLAAGTRAAGRYLILRGWRTTPMPEPRFDGR